jgi:multiple sugar transport system permease protein
MSSRKSVSWGRIAAWIAIVLAIVITIAPFWWMLRTALSTNRALAAHATSLLPAELTLGAFKRVLGLQSAEEALAEGGSGAAINFWLYLRNSVIVSTIITGKSCSGCSSRR